ncbi:hypothetical protein C2W62_13995 [Candidatus Entotheonella serta]|nr:hypothetical protein C2W62_13995 [Candidatus Entotheonella serta]
MFRSLLQRFGYYDIFLIDFESRNLVYSVKKEMDFATNLLTSPYAKHGLAEVVTKVHDRPEHGVQVVDFKAYPPSYEAPAAFMATPIFNGPHIVGIIALQFPVDEINHVMTGNQNWKAEGLGRSGETYLVGPDFLMRSISRFLIEDPEGYIKVLRQVKTPSRKVKLIEQLKTSVLLQEIDTEASRSAIKGETATKLVYDYRDKPVISSYAPLRIEGLNWAIVTKKDVAEAYQPARDQQKRFIIISVILVVLVTFVAIVLANRFVQPLTSLIASAEKIQAGHEEVVEVSSGDEFGQLGRALNGIVNTLRDQNEVIDQKNHEYRMLLDNVLPQGPAERLKRGEEQVAERARHVTVLYASVLGFADLSDQKEAGEAADFLNAL